MPKAEVHGFTPQFMQQDHNQKLALPKYLVVQGLNNIRYVVPHASQGNRVLPTAPGLNYVGSLLPAVMSLPAPQYIPEDMAQ